ncbi:MAG: hypothetical protein AAGB31_15110 [Bdellovibrio sp.]
MKKIIFASAVFLASLTAGATSKEEVQEKTAVAAQAASDYTKEQKEQFQKDMEENLRSLKSEIAELKKSASEKSGVVQAEMKEKIQALEKKQEAVKKDLAHLKKSSGKAWIELKSGVSRAWDSLSESYQKAKSEFKKTN